MRLTRHLKDSLSLRLVWKLNLAAYRNSLAHSTKGTPSHPGGCSDCSWAHGFRYCFTPLPGCFSPFPHGTGSLSVTGEYLALEGGPPCFPPGFTCPAVLWDCRGMPRGVRVRGSHPLRPAFPCRSAPCSVSDIPPGSRPWDGQPATPTRKRPGACTRVGLGWCAFARRYWRNLG